MNVHNRLDTGNNWQLRKELCLQNVYTNLSKLIEASKAPTNVSLATFKPSKITGFEIEQDEREWKNEWKEIRNQGDLFATEKSPEILIPKLPYKFFYRFKDETGKSSRLMIEDWEIGALYWKCLRGANWKEKIVLEKVRNNTNGISSKIKTFIYF